MIGAAFGSQIIAPLAYSSFAYGSPKPAYEYSSSVQTPTYNNYAYVRSGAEFERKYVSVAAPAPEIAFAEQQPAVIATRFAEPQQAVYAARFAEPQQAFIATRYAQPQQAVIATRYAQPQQAVIATRFAEPQPALIAARLAPSSFIAQPNLIELKGASTAEIVKSAIPASLPTNVQLRSDIPLAAPAVALPTTKLFVANPAPIAAVAPAAYTSATIAAAPAAFAAAPAAFASAAFAAPAAKLLLRSDAPAFVAPAISGSSTKSRRFPSKSLANPSESLSAAPAQIIDSVVEQKAVGEGIFERKSQYHTQNELGEATYGHREPFQAHDAVQDAEGNKAGSFSYVSPDGRLLQTDYVADQGGYRVKSNALPEAERLGTAAPVIVEVCFINFICPRTKS